MNAPWPTSAATLLERVLSAFDALPDLDRLQVLDAMALEYSHSAGCDRIMEGVAIIADDLGYEPEQLRPISRRKVVA